MPPDCAPEDFELCGHAYILIPCGVGEECTNVTLAAPNIAPAVSPIFSKKTGWFHKRNHESSGAIEEPIAPSISPDGGQRTILFD